MQTWNPLKIFDGKDTATIGPEPPQCPFCLVGGLRISRNAPAASLEELVKGRGVLTCDKQLAHLAGHDHKRQNEKINVLLQKRISVRIKNLAAKAGPWNY